MLEVEVNLKSSPAPMSIGQLARRLKLPLRCAGNFTTSKLPDAQAMTESTMSMLSAIHCGANFLLHSAGFLDGLLSMSYEKLVLDAYVQQLAEVARSHAGARALGANERS